MQDDDRRCGSEKPQQHGRKVEGESTVVGTGAPDHEAGQEDEGQIFERFAEEGELAVVGSGEEQTDLNQVQHRIDEYERKPPESGSKGRQETGRGKQDRKSRAQIH